MRRVGYWISEKKAKKLNFEEHRHLFSNVGLDLVKIDLKQSLEVQGPFDLLIHKVTDILAKANQGHDQSQDVINNLESYISNHPECAVLDPLFSIRRLLDRYTQYQQVSNSDLLKDHRIVIPTYVELTSTDLYENIEKLAENGVTFPLVCKPTIAHGSSLAHQMAIIFNQEGLKDISPPCVAQSFINHNAILYKILVVGCRQFIHQRPSLKNFYPGNHSTIFFDTQQVSKADSDHPLNEVDSATLEDPPTKPDWQFLDRLGQGMRAAMELDLFGFDVIIDCETNQYGIIDINFFPGFESIDNFFGVLVEHIVNVLDARDRDELVNGRLLSSNPSTKSTFSPHSHHCQLLNQLFQECKGRPPPFQPSSTPIIDLSLPPLLPNQRVQNLYNSRNNNNNTIAVIPKSHDNNGPGKKTGEENTDSNSKNNSHHNRGVSVQTLLNANNNAPSKKSRSSINSGNS